MSELQPSDPATPAPSPMPPQSASSSLDDADYAFGCECADPALQIAQWEQEPRGERA